MTFILGSKCKDGVVLVADRRVVAGDGSYAGYRDKLFNDVDNAVWGASGVLNYFNSFRERVRVAIVDSGGRMSADHFLPMIEEVHGHLISIYGGYFINQFQVMIAPRMGAKAELYVVEGIGGHSTVDEYDTIGSGAPFAKVFLKKLWRKDMGMKEVAELGYFIIKLIERFELEATVGIGTTHPQVWFLPHNPQPKGTIYGDDLRIRSATTDELNEMAGRAEKKVIRFDEGIDAFLSEGDSKSVIPPK